MIDSIVRILQAGMLFEVPIVFGWSLLWCIL